MWIRSQDKEMLVEVKGTVVFDYSYNKIKVDDLTVGRYDTKERAIEVLDEIQSAIEYDNHIGNKPIYEMPKE